MNNRPLLPTPIPWYKSLQSYIAPIKLQDWKSDSHAYLEVYLYQNQYQLTYDNAIYSFGLKYKPFREGFKLLPKGVLQRTQSVLVLGSGLGSIPHLLARYYPNTQRALTIVDIDGVILNLCEQYLKTMDVTNCTFVHGDAWDFVFLQEPQRMDLICVDIFKDISVPEVFLSLKFVERLYSLLANNGYLVFNYIDQDVNTTQQLEHNLRRCFANLKQLTLRKNIIWVAKK